MEDNKRKATELKDKGNAELAKGNDQAAVDYYTEAIALDNTNHILFSNRSAAYLKMSKTTEAEDDADKCIEINPTFSKGYSRKAAALWAKNDLDAAKEVYIRGLEKCPNDEALQQSLNEVSAQAETAQYDQMSQAFGRVFSADMFVKLQADPTTAPFLQDAAFRQVLVSIQKNPGLITQNLSDPRIQTCMTVLLGLKGARAPPSGSSSAAESSTSSSSTSSSSTSASQSHEAPSSSSAAPSSSSSSSSAASTSKSSTPSAASSGPALTEEQKQAVQSKEKGNEAYKNKKFDEAIGFYSKSIELDPNNMVYYTNLAAAQFEKGSFPESIDSCTKAIEVGRSQQADFKLISKAFQRIGNAHAKVNDFKAAVAAYNEAITEWRNPETLALLRKTEQLLDKQTAEAYLNPELAEKAKELGNEAFKSDKLPEAITHYTEAIKRDPTKAVYYSNRAACYTKLMEYPTALKDCDKAIELDPKFIKAYLRKGTAQFRMKQFHKCLETYDLGLKIEPENQEIQEGVRATIEAINLQQQNGVDEKTAKQAMSDPEIQKILKEPMMQQVLSELSRDPRSSSNYLRNPEIAEKLNKLIAAGVIQVK